MSSSPFLPLPPGLEILTTTTVDDLLRVEVVSTRSNSRCPLCFHPARRIHSRYTRVVADVPCGGFQVQLVLQMRKFFCDTPTCPRKIFTERVPIFVQPWARMTTRLSQMLQALGVATCGELGARLSGHLGIHASPTTLLRRVMALPTAPPGPVSILGIDDWSFRRGRKFGTILVDLQAHQVIELLPDRKTETAAAWMQTHGEIELVSRDRGEDYAAAARLGAPQARQVADRFHLTSAPHRRVFDPFWRKERLRANALWGGGLPGGNPQGDNSMPQSRACPKAFTARPDCPAHHGEAELPNLAYQRR